MKTISLRNFTKSFCHLKKSQTFSTYPSYITGAPLTEISKTSNGIRVATEVRN
jgi:hypothetical protein